MEYARTATWRLISPMRNHQFSLQLFLCTSFFEGENYLCEKLLADNPFRVYLNLKRKLSTILFLFFIVLEKFVEPENKYYDIIFRQEVDTWDIFIN